MSQGQSAGTDSRVVGSGYTIFSYAGSPLHLVQVVQDRPPDPVAAPAVVQPIDARHPKEIAFPRAAGAGTLLVTIFEQWDREVWRQFPGYRSGVINDIVDIFERSAAIGGVACVKFIIPPRPKKRRATVYHGCVITNIDMSENVTIEAMTIGRQVQIMYTHTTRRGG